MAKKSLFYIIGYRIGYWIAGSRDRLFQEAVGTLLRRIPGGNLLRRLLR